MEGNRFIEGLWNLRRKKGEVFPFFFFFLFKRKLEFLGEMCFSCFSREEEIDVDYTILFFFFFFEIEGN